MISQEKIQEWVNLYLEHIKVVTPKAHVLEEEGYKFDSANHFLTHYDASASDFAAMLDAAIETNNLVVGSMHFPKKMLLIFAQEYETETRQALELLFNEEVDIAERIDKVEHTFNTLIADRNNKRGEEAHSFINLRFISLLLAFKHPNKYNAIKPREWRVFCKFLEEDFKMPNGTTSGEKYRIFESYIEPLREYIQTIPAIRSLHDQLVDGLEFRDSAFRWMTQDVIYVTARVLAAEKSGEEISTVPVEIIDDESEIVKSRVELEFPLEKYLEHFMVKNWSSIDFGEPLEMYFDEDGTIGEQYTTSVGIIDLLAKDKDGNFVVIELKRGATNQSVVGQILSYMAWVQENLATDGQKVRGLIIVSDANAALHAAHSMVADKVMLKYYRVKFDIIDPA